MGTQTALKCEFLATDAERRDGVRYAPFIESARTIRPATKTAAWAASPP